MGRNTILMNASIVTASGTARGTLLISDGLIGGVWTENSNGLVSGGQMPLERLNEILQEKYPDAVLENLEGRILMAGGIDPHVHFREPGMTAKADIASESRAALLGGVTSFIDMPNTNPATTSGERLREKLELAKGRSYCNYGFHIGATNDNVGEIKGMLKPGRDFCGIKVFMGSSTGNMLVDRELTLKELFSVKGVRILVHCEDEATIRENLQNAEARYGKDIPMREHENIRSRKACIKSTAKALELAMECGTALHITHVTTAEEVEMIRAAKIHNPDISAETSANYLWFCDEDYDRLGSRLKCNPSVKKATDRAALRKALKEGIIDSIGSDHAPHLPEEKARPYTTCPSGVPSIRQALSVLLTVAAEEDIPLSRIADAISEKPAALFGIRGIGKLAEGYRADIIVVNPERTFIVGESDCGNAGIGYKCGWCPYEGTTLRGMVEDVYLGGVKVVNDGRLTGEQASGLPLSFE
ncbi:MAG: amidohydrolase family protein [Candidatus Cryptobacteroides sp.]